MFEEHKSGRIFTFIDCSQVKRKEVLDSMSEQSEGSFRSAQCFIRQDGVVENLFIKLVG